MKRIFIIIFLIGVFALLGLFGSFVFKKGRICVNNERAGVVFLRGGYHAYWIRYSYGLKYPYRTFKDNLWCKPRFEHYDVREILKRLEGKQ